jgi:hypothetical protein
MPGAPVFKETYENYVERISNLDLAALGRFLGYEMDSDEARISCFNRSFWVGPQGIRDKDGKMPKLSVSVILCKYLLMCSGQTPDAQDLVTFKDFKDAAPLCHYFSNAVQKVIENKFQGDIGALENACIRLGGRPYVADLSYQVKYYFQGLPKVPVILFFNDAEEGFVARCTLLFQRSAGFYLDMESLAMLGATLADWLKD